MQRPEQRLPLPGTALGRLFLQNSSNTSRGRRNCFNIEKASSLRFASGLSGWMAHFKRTLRILSSRATPECPRHLRSRPCQESCESRGPRQSPAGRMLEHLYILVINVWQPLREATVASTGIIEVKRCLWSGGPNICSVPSRSPDAVCEKDQLERVSCHQAEDYDGHDAWLVCFEVLHVYWLTASRNSGRTKQF